MDFNIVALNPNDERYKDYDPDAAILIASGWDVGNSNSPNTTHLWLFEDSCPNNNCTSACLDPTVAFSSPFMMANCMTYSTVSGLIGTNNLSTEGLSTAKQFGILSDEQFSVVKVQDVIDKCLAAACGTGTDLYRCGTSQKIFPSDKSPISNIITPQDAYALAVRSPNKRVAFLIRLL
jgi:hypothetical protein